MNRSIAALLLVLPLALGACKPSTDTTGTSATSEASSASSAGSSVSVVIIDLMSAGSSSSASSLSSLAPQSAEGVVEISSASSVPSVSSDSSPTATARIITITAENYKFTPNVITARKGEKVTLQLTGITGDHGFGIPELGINVEVDHGKTVSVDLPTGTAGTFTFLCTIPCGPGHAGMKGQIIIQ